MAVEKKKLEKKNIRKHSDKILEEMAERLKAIDCKSIEFSHRRFESYFLL